MKKSSLSPRRTHSIIIIIFFVLWGLMNNNLSWISTIKVLIWDFDGTFYRQNDALYKQIRESEYQTIINHTGWDYKKTTEEFFNVYKTRFQSATETVAFLSGISTSKAVVEMEAYFDRRHFVSKDQKLIELFSLLHGYQHYILANGSQKGIKESLDTIGIPHTLFKEILTSEVTGANKPNTNGYRYILNKTHELPQNHLMIGDREIVDLVPAKEIGMKTCLVFSKIQSKIADVTLPTVYDIKKLLNK
jgi:HAD superfamily hydrolase (TIGR01549 family)